MNNSSQQEHHSSFNASCSVFSYQYHLPCQPPKEKNFSDLQTNVIRRMSHDLALKVTYITWFSSLRLFKYTNYGTRLMKNENQNKPWCYWNASICLLEKSNAGACGHTSESNFCTNRFENDSNMSSQNFECVPWKFIPE